MFIATQLNSTRRRVVDTFTTFTYQIINVVTQLTQFVGRDVINKNTTDLAVRCSIGSVELSCVAINIPLDSKGDYSATSNNTKLVHWPLIGGL